MSLYGSITDARFLVMLEHDKCSTALIDTLLDYDIDYCFLDDFNSSNSELIKREVLFAEFEKMFPNIYGMRPSDIAVEVYRNAKVNATFKEMDVFCNKYVKTLKLKFDSDKGLIYEIQK